jgi:dTDP-4-amino-4,6-dideoxygalactose transaminase
MSRQPGYLDARWLTLNATRFSDAGFYLPTYTELTRTDQDFIIDRIREFPGRGC